MASIDKRALLEEANCIEVARHIGIQVVQRGANFFMLCPGHEARIGKPDKKIGSCVVYPSGYICYACDPNNRHNVFDMVMEHLNCSFPQALEIVADIYGGKALYASDGREEKKLPLTAEDLELIGLRSGGNMFVPVNGSYQPIEVIDGYKVEHIDKEYLACPQHNTFSLIMLRRDNEAAFNNLILTKTAEAIRRYEKALVEYGSRQSARASEVFDLFNEDGGVKEEVFYGIQNAIKKKLWRCREIYESFSKTTSS